MNNTYYNKDIFPQTQYNNESIEQIPINQSYKQNNQTNEPFMNNIIKKVYKKVFTFSLLPMTLSVILNGKLSENNEKKDNNVKISYEFLDNTSELKLYFSEDISFEVVKKSLENNLSIDDEYRAYTYEFIDLVKKRFPDIDLTILNENIKIFKHFLFGKCQKSLF